MDHESQSYEKLLVQYYQLNPEEDKNRSRNYQEHRELIHACMGLCGESGEVMDLVKKSVNYDRSLNKEELLEECGDVLHYLARILDICGLTLKDAEAANLKKLAKRFPNGYSRNDAINRSDKT